MFKKKICKIGKGIKHFVEEKVQACKEILSSAQNRLILGLTIVGAGIGIALIGGSLITSAYVKAPN